MSLSTLQREAQRLVGAGILQDLTFGPETVIGEEFDLTNVEQVLIYGSWADWYHGTPGPPPNNVDLLVVGNLDRADAVNDADSLVLQIKTSPKVDVTPPAGKAAS